MSKSKIRIKSEIINWPTQTTLTARSSTITSAFVHTITPWLIELTVEEEAAVKKIYTDIESKYGIKILGTTKKDHRCAYCGAKATSADHIYPLVDNCKASGNITEIYNLIPCCSSCNSSKGNKLFDVWYNEPDTIARIQSLTSDYAVRKKALQELIGELDKNSSRNAVNLYRNDPAVAKRVQKVYDMRDDINNRMKAYEAECIALAYDTEIALKGFGAFAQDKLRTKIINARNKTALFANLLDVNYCKKAFNLNYPVLSLLRVDAAGYIRYYSEPLVYKKKTYYICKEWKPSLHRKHLIAWLINN